MTDQNVADIMAKRMALVEKMCARNSKQLRNAQMRSGIEVELLACIEGIERDGKTQASLAHRAELEKRLTEAVTAYADCDRELDGLTDQLNALDRQLSES